MPGAVDVIRIATDDRVQSAGRPPILPDAVKSRAEVADVDSGISSARCIIDEAITADLIALIIEIADDEIAHGAMWNGVANSNDSIAGSDELDVRPRTVQGPRVNHAVLVIRPCVTVSTHGGDVAGTDAGIEQGRIGAIKLRARDCFTRERGIEKMQRSSAWCSTESD